MKGKRFNARRGGGTGCDLGRGRGMLRANAMTVLSVLRDNRNIWADDGGELKGGFVGCCDRGSGGWSVGRNLERGVPVCV
jgi:hypothetical protein